MKKLILCLLLPIIISGCQTIKDLSNTISKPSLSVSDVRVTDFNFNEIELTYDVKVDNPNPVSLQMLSYDYDLKINNNNFIQGDQNKRLNIESSGSSTFQIPMRLNFKELYNLVSGLKGKDEADYNMLANLDFDIPVLGKTTLPLKKAGTLPMVKLPTVNVSNLKVDKLSFTGADLVLNLKVDNPNGFGLLLNSLSYNLDVNGKHWVNGKRSQNLSINKKSNNTLAIPISLNIAQIGTSVFQLLNNNSDVNFDLNGDFDFRATDALLQGLGTNFSFKKSGKLPLIQ